MVETKKQSLIIVIARLFLGVAFVSNGYYGMTEEFGIVYQFFDRLNLVIAPSASKFAGVFTLLGGLALILGFKTKWVSGILVVYCIVTEVGYLLLINRLMEGASLGAPDLAFVSIYLSLMLKNVSMVGGLLLLLCFGPGAWSLDNQNRKTSLPD